MEPQILSENQYKESDVIKLKELPNVILVDVYEKQSKELFEIENPDQVHLDNFDMHAQTFTKARIDASPDSHGDWIYFPWSNHLIHTVNRHEYTTLRTNRNRNIITKEEQQKLMNSCIAFTGLSVGSSIALTTAYQGIAKTMKMSEFDTLDTTNLNRLRAGIHQIGKPKTDIISQQIYEVNPYQKLIPYGRLNKDSLRSMLKDEPKPKIIFDEIDSIAMKIHLRLEARKTRVPVVMLTNLGDSSLLDIERYDLDGSIKPFNGLVDNSLIDEILHNKDSSAEDLQRYVIAIVGKEHIPERTLKSVRQVGKTLVGRPQLVSTVNISSGLAVQVLRKIILGEKIEGRHIYNNCNLN